MESRKISARAALEDCHDPHLKRLAALVGVHGNHDRIFGPAGPVRTLQVGQNIPVIDRPVFLVSGWACRARVLQDGRRQIFSHLLPGDLADSGGAVRGDSGTVITALVRTTVIDAPQDQRGTGLSALSRAYEAIKTEEGRYLCGQLLRLGRLTASERLVHLFLEFAERLHVIGVGSDQQFPLPISQEIVADTLGLTTVHVNRTLQSLRRDNIVKWEAGYVVLTDAPALAAKVYFEPRHAARSFERSTPIDEESRQYDIAC